MPQSSTAFKFGRAIMLIALLQVLTMLVIRLVASFIGFNLISESSVLLIAYVSVVLLGSFLGAMIGGFWLEKKNRLQLEPILKKLTRYVTIIFFTTNIIVFSPVISVIYELFQTTPSNDYTAWEILGMVITLLVTIVTLYYWTTRLGLKMGMKNFKHSAEKRLLKA